MSVQAKTLAFSFSVALWQHWSRLWSIFKHLVTIIVWWGSACLALFVVSVSATAEVRSIRSPQSSVEIELLSNVEVVDAQVSLGEVSKIVTNDLFVLKQLMSLPLGRLTRTSDSVVVERETLQRWIRARTGLAPSEIAWAGAARCELRRASREISGDQIAAVARDSLLRWLEARGLRGEVTVGQPPRDFLIQTGSIDFKVRPIPDSLRLTRRMTVWVDVLVMGVFQRSIPVTFDVSAYGPGYVASNNLVPGSLLSDASLELREVELVDRGVAVTPNEDRSNLRLRRPLAAGDLLTKSHVESVPSVSRGDWATLRISHGLLSLENKVEVLQDGEPGQTIRVKPSNSNNYVLARVVDRGALEVSE